MSWSFPGEEQGEEGDAGQEGRGEQAEEVDDGRHAGEQRSANRKGGNITVLSFIQVTSAVTLLVVGAS